MNKDTIDTLTSICFIASMLFLFIFLPLGLLLVFVGISNYDSQWIFIGCLFMIAGVVGGIACARISFNP